MPESMRFNNEEFAFEEFEGEILVLNLLEGTYYALGGTTPLFWADLTSGVKPARIVSKLQAATKTNETEIAGSLASFLDQLVAEQILLPADSAAEPAEAAAAYSPSQAYSPPVMEKHVDMQDLLTLDPIHDVDPERGWPNV